MFSLPFIFCISKAICAGFMEMITGTAGDGDVAGKESAASRRGAGIAGRSTGNFFVVVATTGHHLEV